MSSKMEFTQYVSTTDLSSNTYQVIHQAQNGPIIIVEDQDHPIAAVLDITDYRLWRSALRYYVEAPQVDPEPDLSSEVLSRLEDPQARCDLVIAGYLSGIIDLGEASRLLGMNWIDVISIFTRLEIPLRTGSFDVDDAIEELRSIRYNVLSHLINPKT